jgi:hypothetical protein
MSEGTIEVRFRLNPVNAWFIRSFARPFISIDGDESQASWSGATEVAVPSGMHRIDAFFRYRGTSSPLGSASTEVRVEAGGAKQVIAENGVMNQTPFHLVVA